MGGDSDCSGSGEASRSLDKLGMTLFLDGSRPRHPELSGPVLEAGTALRGALIGKCASPSRLVAAAPRCSGRARPEQSPLQGGQASRAVKTLRSTSPRARRDRGSRPAEHDPTRTPRGGAGEGRPSDPASHHGGGAHPGTPGTVADRPARVETTRPASGRRVSAIERPVPPVLSRRTPRHRPWPPLTSPSSSRRPHPVRPRGLRRGPRHGVPRDAPRPRPEGPLRPRRRWRDPRLHWRLGPPTRRSPRPSSR